MGVVGFVDDSGEAITFEQMRAGKGAFSTAAGAPVPRTVVRALAKGYRSEDHYGDPDVVSVTSLIAPPQIKRLEQRHRLFVRPLDNVWAKFGTIAHGFMEEEVGDQDIAEVKLVIERNGVKVGGTFDLLEAIDSTSGGLIYQGRDYKIISGYSVKKMIAEGVYKGHEEYFWQAQMYAMMVQDPDVKAVLSDGSLGRWDMANKVTIDNWGLVAIARDWNKRMAVHFGPLEVIDVPLIEKSRVENWLNQRLMVWQAAGLADDAGLPQCTGEEMWQGRRCLDYCPVSQVCHQNRPELDIDLEAELAS